MKNKILTSTTVLATLMSISQIAHADDVAHQFTPIENLPPEIRQEVSAKVFELTKNMEIDWDNVAVGLNEDGKIFLVSKLEFVASSSGGFSCATHASVTIEEKQSK
jgi:hypothetical protein